MSLFEQGARIANRKASEPVIVAATLVSATHIREPGQLQTFSLANVKDELAKRLERSELGGCVVIGGIDFSFNIEGQTLWNPHWQPHAYILLEGKDKAQLKEAIKKYYPRAETIERPFRAKYVESLMKPISYAVKSCFCTRSSYLEEDGHRNTINQSLKPRVAAELTVYLDQTKPTDRIILRKVRLEGDKLVRKT